MARITHLNDMHRGADGAEMNADDIGFTPDSPISSTNVQDAIMEAVGMIGGGGGPFEDVDTFAWRFIPPAEQINSSDDTSYLNLDTNAAQLWAYAGNTIIIQDGKITTGSDFGMVLPVLSSDPGGGDSEEGQVYYNSSSDKIRWYNGSAWADLGGAGHTHVYSEVPSGTINGSNDTFTLAATPASGTLRLYKNGLRQKAGAGNDYTLATATITFLAGNIPQTGDNLLADYNG